MKKILIISILLGGMWFSVLPQKGKVTAALNLILSGEFEKAKANLDAAAVNVKTANWPKTYYAYGKFYQALYKSNRNDLKSQYGNLLGEAFQNFKKAYELDTLRKIGDQMDLDVYTLYTDLFSEGVKHFEHKDYNKALNSWETALASRAYSKLTNDKTDSSTIYNAGIAALNAQNYPKAIEYFGKARDIKYGGSNTYILLKNCYLGIGDSLNALNTLKEGFQLNQDDQNIIIELINYYLMSKNSNDALTYLALAKEQDPTNASFYHAEGTLYDKMGEFQKAVESYQKAIELRPDFFDSYYNLGVVYFNRGLKLYEEANMEMDLKKYEAKKVIADEVYAKAIPVFEKALELIPNDNNKKENTIGTLDNLKNLYFRFRSTNPEYEKKYNEVISKIKELKGE